MVKRDFANKDTDLLFGINQSMFGLFKIDKINGIDILTQCAIRQNAHEGNMEIAGKPSKHQNLKNLQLIQPVHDQQQEQLQRPYHPYGHRRRFRD